MTTVSASVENVIRRILTLFKKLVSDCLRKFGLNMFTLGYILEFCQVHLEEEIDFRGVNFKAKEKFRL